MTIKEQEELLFNRWKSSRKYQHFIADGVFDEAEWQNQKRRIVFVMKEANWKDDSADMCEWVMSEESPTYWKSWNNIVRWTIALLEGGEYPRYVSRSDKTFWLKKTAFLNLKKPGGSARSSDKEIREYARRDANFIREQIGLYDPDIIICCGRGEGKNADILYEYVFAEDTLSSWQEPIGIYNYYFVKLRGTVKMIPVISFYHPQIIGSHEIFEKRYKDMLRIRRELESMGYFQQSLI